MEKTTWAMSVRCAFHRTRHVGVMRSMSKRKKSLTKLATPILALFVKSKRMRIATTCMKYVSWSTGTKMPSRWKLK